MTPTNADLIAAAKEGEALWRKARGEFVDLSAQLGGVLANRLEAADAALAAERAKVAAYWEVSQEFREFLRDFGHGLPAKRLDRAEAMLAALDAMTAGEGRAG